MKLRFSVGQPVSSPYLPSIGWVAGCRSSVDGPLYWIAAFRPRYQSPYVFYIPPSTEIIFPIPDLWLKQFNFIQLYEHQFREAEAGPTA